MKGGYTYFSELFIVFFLLFFAITFIHEYTHYFTAKYFGYKSKVLMSILKNSVTMFEGFIHKNHFICIAIMPFVLILFLFIISLLIFPYKMFVIALFSIKLIGCVSDFYLIIQALKFDKSYYFYSEFNPEVHNFKTYKMKSFRMVD